MMMTIGLMMTIVVMMILVRRSQVIFTIRLLTQLSQSAGLGRSRASQLVKADMRDL